MSDNNTSKRFEKPGVILALIALPVFIGALDLTIVSAVLPSVIYDLNIPFQSGADEAAWILSGYLLAYTVSVAMMGRVSDIIGRRRTYFIALLVFILGSWLVATASFAPTDWMRWVFRLIVGGRPDTAFMSLYALIGGRIIQALGAGAMVPVSMALVSDLYPAAKRAMALGIIGAVDTAGWVLGHLYGGVMVQYVDWEVLFWINIPITAVIAYITWRQLAPVADSHDEGGLSRPTLIAVIIGMVVVNGLAILEIIRAMTPFALDDLSFQLLDMNWLSGALALIFIVAVVLTTLDAKRAEEAKSPNWGSALLLTLFLIGLNIGAGGGETGLSGDSLESVPPFSPIQIGMLIMAAVSLIGFILIERRTESPLFDFRYFSNRNISLASVINLLVGFCLMVGLVSVPLFVNSVIAVDADQGALLSGILLGALTIPMAIASIPGGLLTERFGYRVPTAGGMLLAGVGFYLASTWASDVSQTTMAWHMSLAGIGMGLTVAPISTAVINAVREREHGIAAALVLIMRLIGMTLGTSMMIRYGLRRTSLLTNQIINAADETLDFAALIEIAVEVITQVIDEMLLIAAVVAFVSVIPALFLRSTDRVVED